MNDEGRIHTLWPYSSFRFRAELSRFDLVAYEAEPRSAARVAPVSAPVGR
jgi:hypothetical protein